MKNVFNHLKKDLTTTDMIIGAFSFVVGGIGVIYICLTAWDFIVSVFG